MIKGPASQLLLVLQVMIKLLPHSFPRAVTAIRHHTFKKPESFLFLFFCLFVVFKLLQFFIFHAISIAQAPTPTAVITYFLLADGVRGV